jgi:predicted phosphodiesterase
MRIAIFGDIHSNLTALRAVLDDIEREGPFNLVVSNGDQLSGGPRPRATWDELRDRGVCVMCGDAERDLDTERFPPEPAGGPNRATIQAIFEWTLEVLPQELRAEAAALPRELRLGVDHARDLLITHANAINLDDFIWTDTSPAELERLVGNPVPGMMVIGHIHAPLDMDFNSTRIVRPGSVGLKYEPRWYNVAHWVAVHWDASRGSWSARTRAVTWDHRAEIEEGRCNGYPGVEILPGYGIS